MAAAPPTLTGWMTKKAEKIGKPQKRFFELLGSEIKYFGKTVRHVGADRGTDAKGTIAIDGSTKAESNSCRLTIINIDRTWELSTDTPAQALQWATAINNTARPPKPAPPEPAAAARAVTSPLPLSPSPSGPAVQGSSSSSPLLSVASPPSALPAATVDGPTDSPTSDAVAAAARTALRSSVRKRDSTSSLGAPPSSLPPPPAGPPATLSSGSLPMPASPVAGFWLSKKGEGFAARDQLRYFLLESGGSGKEFAYYESVQSDQPIARKGAIPLTTASGISVRGTVVEIKNPDRLWVLTANSLDEAARVAVYLRTALGLPNTRSGTTTSLAAAHTPGATPSSTTDSSRTTTPSVSGGSPSKSVSGPASSALGNSPAADDEPDQPAEANEVAVPTSGPAKGVWLSKKGEGLGVLTAERRRYFTLLFGADTNTLKFTYFEDVRNGVPVGRKGFVPVSAASRIAAAGTHITVDNPGRVWQLTAASAEEAAHWAKVLADARDASLRAKPALAVPTAAAAADDDDEATQAAGEVEESISTHGVWLTKAGEGLGRDRRRWFILQRGLASRALRLTYFANVRNNVGVDRKGCIDIDGASSVGSEGCLITINNPGRLWKLTADTPAEADALAALMRRALEEARVAHDKMSAKPAMMLLDGGEQMETEVDDPVLTELEKEVFEGAGAWFVKKGEGVGALTGGKRRYFVLRYGQSTGMLRLNYYSECVDGTPRDKKGYIPISHVSTFTAQGKTLLIHNPDRVWHLTADSSDDAATWQGLLSRAHSKVASWATAELADSDDEAVGVAGEEDRVGAANEGVWLVKKGEGGLSFLSDKKRYFVLRWGLQSNRLKFAYYEAVKDGVPQKKKGAIVLTPASIITAQAKSLTIENQGERTWQLTAATAEEAELWAGHLRQHIGARYPEGELPAGHTEDDEAEEELPGIALWLHKRGEGLGAVARDKKRFFTLTWGVQTQALKLCYYTSLQHGLPVNRKGFVLITPATLMQASGKSITLENADRKWHLTAANARQAGDFVKTIKNYVTQKYPDGAEATPVGEEQEILMLPGEGAWMLKKADGLLARDQRRFFALVFGLHTRRVKIAYYSDVSDGVPVGKKGAIELSAGQTRFEQKEKELRVITSERTWQLTGDDATQVTLLVDRSKRCIGEQRPDVNNGMPLLARLRLLVAELRDKEVDVTAECLTEELMREYGASVVGSYAGDISKAAETAKSGKLPGAWFSKKAEKHGKDRRRFFELFPRELKYYEGAENGKGVGYKGSVFLHPTTTVMRAGAELVITNPDRKWELIGPDSKVVGSWMRAIALCLHSAFGTELPEELDWVDDNRPPLKAAWFGRKETDGSQQRRWIVLSGEGNRLACFRGMRTDGVGAVGEELLATLGIKPMTRVSVGGDGKLLIATDKNSWELQAGDNALAVEWAMEIRRCRNVILQASPEYETYLAGLEEAERGTAEDDMRILREAEELRLLIERERRERELREAGIAPAPAGAVSTAPGSTEPITTADVVIATSTVSETAFLAADALGPGERVPARAASANAIAPAPTGPDSNTTKKKKGACCTVS
eukprot:m.77744 g.77744  ORF g.77744 m.77744 type:complete len:1563 (+) comp7929_c0_seq1:66-4754(+)